jgi:hypothetical protein
MAGRRSRDRAMIDWQPVNGSERIVAEAYDEERDTIYVRFPNGVEWAYAACPRSTWETFTAPGQSRGQYINEVLNYKPNHRHSG